VNIGIEEKAKADLVKFIIYKMKLILIVILIGCISAAVDIIECAKTQCPKQY
jgi:hypothetical protein